MHYQRLRTVDITDVRCQTTVATNRSYMASDRRYKPVNSTEFFAFSGYQNFRCVDINGSYFENYTVISKGKRRRETAIIEKQEGPGAAGNGISLLLSETSTCG
jgi:hypothetical protein